jgi:phosphoacetylglucosamine mutase
VHVGEHCDTEQLTVLSILLLQDRRAIVTTDAERKCVSPPELQDQINILVNNFPNGRSFVRYANLM